MAEYDPTAGQRLFKMLRVKGFTLTRAAGNVLDVRADDAELYNTLDAHSVAVLQSCSDDILHHIDAVEVLTRGARQAGNTAEAEKLWMAVISYDPLSEEATEFFDRQSASASLAAPATGLRVARCPPTFQDR